MRKYLSLIFVCLVAIPIAAQKNRPNIIYIMADDLGFADLSCYGRKDYSTPNIDKLAASGIRFENAYSAAPVCTPTRVGFMTGRYPARLPIGLKEPWVPTKKDSAFGLGSDQPTVSSLLKKAGYETALIGKWHLGSREDFTPAKNGFDFFYGIKTGAADYVSHRGDLGRPDLFLNDMPITEEGYLTDLITQRAIGYIKQKHTKPFFLSLQFTAPHWPWQGPGDPAYPDTMRMAAGGSPAIYAAMMKSFDDAVGRIMAAIKESGLSNKTLIIFTSDNGGERFSDMGIYSGKKMQLREGGVRVPAFASWQGSIKPASTTEQAAITMDWTATILSAAGVKPNSSYPLDGINLLPVMLKNKKTTERTFYWRIHQRAQQSAIREGKWKYLKDEKGEYLFDLEADPSEKNNLNEKEKEVFEKLKTKFSKWEAMVLKPIPL